jgi:phage anti-repressor protein
MSTATITRASTTRNFKLLEKKVESTVELSYEEKINKFLDNALRMQKALKELSSSIESVNEDLRLELNAKNEEFYREYTMRFYYIKMELAKIIRIIEQGKKGNPMYSAIKTEYSNFRDEVEGFNESLRDFDFYLKANTKGTDLNSLFEKLASVV